jgi:hypothetical protein
MDVLSKIDLLDNRVLIAESNFSDIFSSSLSRASVIMGCGLDVRRVWVQFPAEAKDFYLLHNVQTGSEAHPAACPVGTGGLFPWR